MVLLSKPVSSGRAQDVYDVLDEAYGGSEFDANEAAVVVAQSLEISENEASSAIRTLVSSGCAQ